MEDRNRLQEPAQARFHCPPQSVLVSSAEFAIEPPLSLARPWQPFGVDAWRLKVQRGFRNPSGREERAAVAVAQSSCIHPCIL